MSYRVNPNQSMSNSISNQKPIPNPPVSLIKSTYDPSRQISAMQQSLKNMPNQKSSIQNPVPLQSYPQPSKNISMPSNMNSSPQLNMENKQNSHPSESGRPTSGLPIHPNSREGEHIRHTQNLKNMQNTQQETIIIDKVCDKIYNHFKVKYPTTIEASGFSKNTISTIVSQSIKKEPLNEKTISKIIDIIDHKFKTTINSDNRQGTQYDTTNFSMDTESKISVDKYLENYTNKVSILLDNSDKAIEAELPKKMAPINEQVKIPPSEPFSEDFPIRDRTKQTDMMIPEVREYDYYIVVNSNDRNIVKYPDPSKFVIDFAPAPTGDAHQTGYIDRAFNNIKSCELISIVLLDTSNIAGSSESNSVSHPYLLLHFDELQNNFYATNSHLSKAFAILTDYTVTGKYRYYSIFGSLGDSSVSRVYNPRINLNKLTTSILLPDGSPYNFGSENTSDTSNSCITFGFKITTIQKNLATSFINSS
jgi:hypothetical protein